MNEQPNTQTNNSDDEIDLKEIILPLWQRAWKIILIAVFVAACVYGYVSLLKPSYQATAILQIGSNKISNSLSIEEAFSQSAASKEQIQTQYELLRSRKFAERVISKFDLTRSDDFSANKYRPRIAKYLKGSVKQKTELSLNQAVAIFAQRLTVSPVSGTELVKISFTAYNPELAKNIANYIGQVYLDYKDEIQNAAQENTSKWLIEQLEELVVKLENSEQKLQQYREQQGIVDIDGIVGLVATELKTLKSSLTAAIKTQDDRHVSYQYIQQFRENQQRLLNLSEIAHHVTLLPLLASQEKITRKLYEVSQRYGRKHPKRMAAASEVEAINEAIAVQIGKVVDGIEKEYLNAGQKIKAIQARVDAAKKDFVRLTRLQNKFSQLQREVLTNKELYNSYLVKLKEADAMDNYKSDFYVRFIDKAVTPTSAVAPKKKLIVILAFLLAAMLASLYVLIRELPKNSLNSHRKLENFSEAPVLAVLPEFKQGSKVANDVNRYGDNRFVEEIRRLRTSLLFNGEKKLPKVIAITSSLPSEGKSTVAYQLAKSFGELEKVLLIEGDLRHPTLANRINLSPYRPGLSNLLAKTHDFEQCIIRKHDRLIDIITSGITPSNPINFLTKKRFSILLEQFGQFYDRIIIETPPVIAVSDPIIIGRLADTVLYVANGEKTPRDQIYSGLRMLKQANINTSGLIINRSKQVDHSRYSEKYYHSVTNIIKWPKRKAG
ncbi:GumC family protein [Thalassotalea sp. PLHSN55]|uniref:GumC family protein n=1 Tax=Thalassotalea sp. PLHSN55 TaxID=3435888 RepID=UPI003F84F3FA